MISQISRNHFCEFPTAAGPCKITTAVVVVHLFIEKIRKIRCLVVSWRNKKTEILVMKTVRTIRAGALV